MERRFWCLGIGTFAGICIANGLWCSNRNEIVGNLILYAVGTAFGVAVAIFDPNNK